MNHAEDHDLRRLLKESIARLREVRVRAAALESQQRAPIAVVGMGCRFPGGGDGPEAYWRALCAGVDGVREVPPDRWDADALPDPGTRWAGLLDDVAGFDAEFFGISPREATRLDPQQRLLLEVAWEALEHGGLRPSDLVDGPVGVFVGLTTQDYGHRAMAVDLREMDVYTTTGNGLCFAAGRIAYALGLRGPALCVDTACSSSLVAVHLACESLRRGETSLALAGGCNLLLSPLTMHLVAQTRALSPGGRCRSFDARADGFVRGEGCGVVALKRLSDAERDGDRVWAVVRGSAVNQDGRSTGLTAPNVLAQQALLRQALASAGLSPERVGYVEAHGTGTSLGDPIEVEALRGALGTARADGSPCFLGAVKANLGHLEAAAGIAGFIKAVLALHHRAVPPQLHFKTLNPRISFAGTPFQIPLKLEPWAAPGGEPRIAGVSSFGLSGTNAHVLLEEAPVAQPTRDAEHEARSEVLTVSARTAEALAVLTIGHRDWLGHTDVTLRDICASASQRRDHHEHRLAIVAASKDAAVMSLDAVIRTGPSQPPGRPAAGPKVFVFGGQGSQWLGMARSPMADERVFRAALERCHEAMRPFGFSLLDELRADASTSRLEESDITPPVLFAVQVALAALWSSWGMRPDVVLGHSQGEIAAAHVAAALSLEDAVRIVCTRSQLVRERGGDNGRMLATELSPERAAELVAPYEDRVVVAVQNSPRYVVLSGEQVALAEIRERLVVADVFCRPVNVRFASHSPQMRPVATALARRLAGIRPQNGVTPFFSTVTGRFEDGAGLGPDYWARNLESPVRFAAAVASLAGAGHRCFIELGGHPILIDAVRDCLGAAGVAGIVVGSLERDRGSAALLENLGRLYTAGAEVDWSQVHPKPHRPCDLPRYPWQRQRYWLEPAPLPSGTHPVAAAAPTASVDIDAWLYEVAWALSPSASPPVPADAGLYILWGGPGDAVDALALALRSAGQSCVRAVAGPRFESGGGTGTWRVDPAEPAQLVRLLREAQRLASVPLRGVVHLEGLVAPPPEPATGAPAAADITALARFAPALDEVRDAGPGRLWLVTRGVHSVGATPTVCDVARAPLWGFGKVLAVEHPDAWGGAVDLDPGGVDFTALAGELLGPHGEDLVAHRQGRRHVARLRRSPGPAERTLQLRRDGTYLVTGGLGGLGRHVARWLVDRGAGAVVLIGRGGARDADRSFVAGLACAGVDVRVEQADVADATQMARVFQAIEATGKPLRGIVHAAGVGAHRSVREFDPDEYAAVMRPKWQGAWNLHRLSLELPLDFFIMFSSFASVGGSRGQAAYGAANHCLDVLAHHRRAAGLPALTIGWGLWAGDGMVDEHVRDTLNRMGIAAMSPAGALLALERLLARGVTHGVVADVDWPQLREVVEGSGERPLFRGLTNITLGKLAPAASLAETASAVVARLRAAAPVDRLPTLIAYVRSQAAAVLRVEPDRVDVDKPLQRMGMDSLMGSELRRSLELEGVKANLAMILTGASVTAVAADLLARFELAPPDATQPDATQPDATPSAPHAHPEAFEARTPWLIVPSPIAAPRMRLFCFAYAGGGPPVYARWPQALPDDIEVAAVQLPARGSRLHEPPILAMAELIEQLAEALVPRLDRPFAFFGHCLGAMTMFELSLRLRERGLPAPEHLFVSGARSPRSYRPEQVTADILQFSARPPLPAHELTDELLVATLQQLNFATTAALLDEELRRLMLPAVRADFRLSNEHTYRERAPLDVPITAVGGRSDPYVNAAQLLAWREHTTAEFQAHFRPGDHYFIESERPFLVELVARSLARRDGVG